MAKQKKSPIRFLILLLFAAVIVLLCIKGGMWWSDYQPSAAEGTNKIITIASGSTTTDIAQLLTEQQIIRYPSFFKLIVKLNKQDGAFKEGVYELNSAMGYQEIMKILKGEEETAALVRVTIPEGFEFRQIAERIANAGLSSQEELIKIANHDNFDYDFIRSLPSGREYRLEGYVFPDTYYFPKNATAHDIIDTMLRQFQSVYTDSYKQRAQELAMTIDQIVTLASIIEREAAGDEDRKDVASVFHNRLKSSSYPYLQSCATVQYILKERKPVLSEHDTRIASPYNTYQNKGLPIGPIASPGKASIEAALYPNDTDYLFFVVGKENKHVFSKTYQQHLAAMKQ